jgi:Zn-dependent protease
LTVSSSPPLNLELRQCKTCGAELHPGDLVCAGCHTLIYAEELTILSHRATRLEQDGASAEALAQWRKALPLLPAHVTQSDWVLDHIRKLELAQQAAPAQPKNAWARKLGPLAPIAIFLAKAKWIFAIFKFKFLLSLGAFFAVYWSLFGWKFGVGFGVLVLIHEMGHFIDIRRRGLPADMPVFLPGFGAYVRWQAMGISLETRAAVSLAGPLAGLLASLGCLFLFWNTGAPLWAALTRSGAWLNLLNLIPIWVLDGGQAVKALDRTGRAAILAGAVVFGFCFAEGVFFFVALGAAWRLFTKDMAPVGSLRVAAYFIGIMGFLGLVLRAVPGHGFGAR